MSTEIEIYFSLTTAVKILKKYYWLSNNLKNKVNTDKNGIAKI